MKRKRLRLISYGIFYFNKACSWPGEITNVLIDDPVKSQMFSFMTSSNTQQDIVALDNKIHETVEQINSIRIQREFFLGFATDPQKFINDWMAWEKTGHNHCKKKTRNTRSS